MATKRKAPAGTYWRGETLWGRIQVAGREIKWSLRTGDPEVAKGRREARRQREVAAAHYGDDRKTWEDAVVAWTDHIVHEIGPATIKRYLVSLGQVRPHLAGCYLDEIDKHTLKTLIRERRKANASTATVRRDLVAISSVLAFAEDEDWIDTNPVLARLKKLKERRDPIALPDPAHVAEVIAAAPGLLSVMIDVARKTGCRQNELVTLTRRNLDWPRRQLTVLGKGNKRRTIDMLDAYDPLRAAAVHMRGQRVFWHDDGQPYANVASRFAAITASAHLSAQREGRDFRRFRFHDLRHLFAVEYLKDGKGSLRDLQLHLGHESVKTTEAYLRFLTPDEARAALDRPAQKPEHVQRSEDAGSA